MKLPWYLVRLFEVFMYTYTTGMILFLELGRIPVCLDFRSLGTAAARVQPLAAWRMAPYAAWLSLDWRAVGPCAESATTAAPAPAARQSASVLAVTPGSAARSSAAAYGVTSRSATRSPTSAFCIASEPAA